MNHPEVEAKLVEEVLRVMGPDTQPSYQQLSEMRYLNAVLKVRGHAVVSSQQATPVRTVLKTVQAAEAFIGLMPRLYGCSVASGSLQQNNIAYADADADQWWCWSWAGFLTAKDTAG